MMNTLRARVIIVVLELLLIVGRIFGIYGLIHLNLSGVMTRTIKRGIILEKTELYKLWRTKN